MPTLRLGAGGQRHAEHQVGEAAADLPDLELVRGHVSPRSL